MSYRLIDSNAIAIKYPEVNEMPCVFADLPDGLNGQFINAQPERKKGRKKGKWIDGAESSGNGWWDPIIQCSVCGYKRECDGEIFDFCPNCGADMRGKKNG